MSSRNSRVAALVSTAILGAEAVVIAVSFVWGRRLQARVVDVKLGAAPFVGAWEWRPGMRLVPAGLIGALVVWFGPRLARSAPFRLLCGVGAASAAMFAGALAFADGSSAMLAPVVHSTEYWANLSTLPPAGAMLRVFGTRDFLVNWSVHLKGHPPGFVLLLKALRHIGLGHPWMTGALSFVGIALTCVAAPVAVRVVVGEAQARAMLPFLVLAPFALWEAISADALYAGVFAVGVAALAVGARAHTAVRGAVISGLGGLTLGSALFLSYGAATLLPLAVAVALVGTGTTWPVRAGRCVCAALGASAVLLVFRHFGFWWFDGLRTTRQLYWEGTAKFRPWTYFLVGNIGVLLMSLGPAGAVALSTAPCRSTPDGSMPEGSMPDGSMPDRSTLGRSVPSPGQSVAGFRTLIFVTIACVAAANASQYSKGEVERIWLLFMPWLMVATASLRRTGLWLGLQLAAALVLQAWLVSKW